LYKKFYDLDHNRCQTTNMIKILFDYLNERANI
jgi:hypothetical protein